MPPHHGWTGPPHGRTCTQQDSQKTPPRLAP